MPHRGVPHTSDCSSAPEIDSARADLESWGGDVQMSKDAAMRAMREARYADRSAGSPATPRQSRQAVRPTKIEGAEPVAPAVAAEASCGHRSMNGRRCTRELGHTAKSHRYS